MQFVYPSFLFALFATLIPVVIHLFHFRRYKKIVFSDIRFLKQIEEQSKSQRRLRDWLVLICRILAISFLVLAFAQPFIPENKNTIALGEKAVSLYIDNSFSMRNEGEEGDLLETAKNKARAILNAYGTDATFQVLTNDFEGWQQRWMSKSEALQRIDAVNISPDFKTLKEVYKKQVQAFEQNNTRYRASYLISDFQQNMFNEDFVPDSVIQLTLVPVKSNTLHNVYIDSVWLVSPFVSVNDPLKIKVSVVNSSNESIENLPLTLIVNGAQKALQNVSLDAGGKGTTELTFTPGQNDYDLCELTINDHPITFDDRLYFIVKPKGTSGILCINGHAESKYINTLFSKDPHYQFITVTQNQVDVNVFNKQDFIILNEPAALTSGLVSELKKFVEQGGQLMIIPSENETDISALNDFLTMLHSVIYQQALTQEVKVDYVNIRDDLFKDVYQKVPKNPDMPVVKKYYSLFKSNFTRGKSLMTLNNGASFVWQNNLQEGSIIVLSVPLNSDWSNLQQHAVFVPLLLKAALGVKKQSKLYYTIGDDQWINIEDEKLSNEKAVHLWNKEMELTGEVSMRGGKRELYIDHQLKQADHYGIAPKAQKEPSTNIALNYSRKESPMQYIAEEKLLSWAEKHKNASVNTQDAKVFQQQIKTDLSGTPLWRWMILAVLLSLLTEILLLRIPINK